MRGPSGTPRVAVSSSGSPSRASRFESRCATVSPASVEPEASSVPSAIRRRAGNDRGRLAAVHPRVRRGRETRLPLLSGLRRDRVLHRGGLAWSCGRPGGRVRGSFLPCADEVGLGGAATFVAAASRRHRARALTGGEVTRLGQRVGMSPDAWLVGGDVQCPKNGIESREHPVGWRAPESGIELDEPPPDDDWAHRKGSESHRKVAKV